MRISLPGRERQVSVFSLVQDLPCPGQILLEDQQADPPGKGGTHRFVPGKVVVGEESLDAL